MSKQSVDVELLWIHWGKVSKGVLVIAVVIADVIADDVFVVVVVRRSIKIDSVLGLFVTWLNISGISVDSMEVFLTWTANNYKYNFSRIIWLSEGIPLVWIPSKLSFQKLIPLDSTLQKWILSEVNPFRSESLQKWLP